MSIPLSKPDATTHLLVTNDAFVRDSGTAVDCHFHIFQAHRAVPGARYTPAYSANLSDWATQAQGCRVKRGLLVQPSFLGTDNSLMRQALTQSGLPLRGVAVISPDSPMQALRDMHAEGVRGIRLNLSGVSHDVSAWCGAEELWATLSALGWHLELHTDQGALPSVLTALLPSLPLSLQLVLDHFAKPMVVSADDETLRAVAGLVASGRRVSVKLSGAYRIGSLKPSVLAQWWLAELGAQSLLWGSDWPCTNHETLANYAQLHGSLDDWLEDPDLIHQVRVVNPHRLLA